VKKGISGPETTSTTRTIIKTATSTNKLRTTDDGSTILVTGATGTVGSEVVRQLSTKGQGKVQYIIPVWGVQPILSVSIVPPIRFLEGELLFL